MQGGANAGHTIYDSSGKKYALHLVPSGILNEAAQCMVGNGVVVHLPTLFEEIATLEAQGVSTQRLIISERAHLLFDLHKAGCQCAAVTVECCTRDASRLAGPRRCKHFGCRFAGNMAIRGFLCALPRLQGSAFT